MGLGHQAIVERLVEDRLLCRLRARHPAASVLTRPPPSRFIDFTHGECPAAGAELSRGRGVIVDVLQQLLDGRNLSRELARATMNEIMSGAATALVRGCFGH